MVGANKTQASAEQSLLDASKFGRVMRWLGLPCYGVASPIEEQSLLDASKFGRVMRWLALPCYGVASPIEVIVDREIKESKGGEKV